MAFILVPQRGDDVQVNAWTWRPTLLLLRTEGVITDDQYDRFGMQIGASVDAELAARIADAIDCRLIDMRQGERLRGDLSVTSKPKRPQVFTPHMSPDEIDARELYSASYEWLEEFRNFCRSSGGFEVG